MSERPPGDRDTSIAHLRDQWLKDHKEDPERESEKRKQKILGAGPLPVPYVSDDERDGGGEGGGGEGGSGDQGDGTSSPPPDSGPPTDTGTEPPPLVPEGATFAPIGKKPSSQRDKELPADVIPIKGDSSTPETAPIPSRLVPAAVAVLVLLGVVGFAMTRSDAQPSAAPAPVITAPPLPTTTSAATAAPAVTVPVTAPRVTDIRITEQGNVCLDQTTFILSVKTEGAKAGDAIHIKITGPGLPSEANGTLGADGTMTGTIGVAGPVKGNQSWSAQVDQIAGKPIVSGPSQVFGFCPTS